jgi:hypothetical protein
VASKGWRQLTMMFESLFWDRATGIASRSMLASTFMLNWDEID